MPVIFDPVNRDDQLITRGDSVEFYDFAADSRRWGVAIDFNLNGCFVEDILGHSHVVPFRHVRLWRLTGKPHPTDEALVIARAEAKPAHFSHPDEDGKAEGK